MPLLLLLLLSAFLWDHIITVLCRKTTFKSGLHLKCTVQQCFNISCRSNRCYFIALEKLSIAIFLVQRSLCEICVFIIHLPTVRFPPPPRAGKRGWWEWPRTKGSSSTWRVTIPLSASPWKWRRSPLLRTCWTGCPRHSKLYMSYQQASETF